VPLLTLVVPALPPLSVDAESLEDEEVAGASDEGSLEDPVSDDETVEEVPVAPVSMEETAEGSVEPISLLVPESVPSAPPSLLLSVVDPDGSVETMV
jgi:hypothetical protein